MLKMSLLGGTLESFPCPLYGTGIFAICYDVLVGDQTFAYEVFGQVVAHLSRASERLSARLYLFAYAFIFNNAERSLEPPYRRLVRAAFFAAGHKTTKSARRSWRVPSEA